MSCLGQPFEGLWDPAEEYSVPEQWDYAVKEKSYWEGRSNQKGAL